MLELSRPVEGTQYTVKACSVQDMQDMMNTEGDLGQMAYLASVSTEQDGVRVWPTLEAALKAPWPLVQRCAEAALQINGMVVNGEHSGN